MPKTSTLNPSWIDAGFVLGDWEVRPRHCTLLRRGGDLASPTHIEPRVMAVLACLARHAGEVVTRDEFSKDVWGGRAVSDEALSRCISLLRQVLGDDSRDPRFIRTIARIGYALVPTPAPLVSLEAAALPQAEVTPPANLPPPKPSPPRPARNTRHRNAVLATCILVMSVAAVLVVSQRERHPREASPLSTRLLVLPFDTSDSQGLGNNIGVELADEISDLVSHVDRLQVSGSTSADTLAAAHTGAVEAGRKVGVDAVLNGEITEQPGALRVTIRLTAVKDGRVLWTNAYERAASDLFAAQSSIAAAVRRDLIGLLNREGLAGVPHLEPDSRDPEAYQLYLRGVHQVRLRGEDSLRRAVELFSAAARRDPSYARVEVGLASAYALLPSYSDEDPTEMYALADQALEKADRLSHNRSESAGARAYLGFMRGQWIESETAFRTAIIADPNNPEVRQWYSQLLGTVGRIEAALAQARLAQEIDPLAPVVADRLSILDLWSGRDAEAAKDAALARELGLDEVAYPETKVLLKLHQHEDAQAADDLRSLLGSLHRSNAWVDPTIDAYRHPEKRAVAVQLLDHAVAAEDISPRVYFGLMVLLESPARALRGYAALPERGGNDLELLFSVDAAAVRRDPLFGEFIRKIGLETYWDRFGWPSVCHRDGKQIQCR